MCLAEFAASYSTCYNIKDDEVYNDELPDTDSEGSTKILKRYVFLKLGIITFQNRLSCNSE